MKKIIIAIIIVIIIIGIAVAVKGTFFKKEQVTQIVPTPTVVLPTISEDIKVDLTANAARTAVTLKINGIPTDIESIEYELTYLTIGDLPRGVLGKIILAGESEIVRDDLVLGTCSSGRCVYDKGVTSIDLTLKFNSSTGSSVFQKTYPL